MNHRGTEDSERIKRWESTVAVGSGLNDDETAFLPTASLTVLRHRARLLALMRRFFDDRGYFEVQTPVLSVDGPLDTHLEAFVTYGPQGPNVNMGKVAEPPVMSGGVAAGQMGHVPPCWFLQTSPEFAMKRLLVAGADAIYQLGPVFRGGESGRLHNPEFTMLEWYRAGDSHIKQMQVVEELVRQVLLAGRELTGSSGPPLAAPFHRVTYRDAFLRSLHIDVASATIGELRQAAHDRSLSIPPGLSSEDRDGWLNLLLAECIEPHLGRGLPEFLYDYPASQASLARVRPDPGFAVGERFELYVAGVELCNGYHELTDASELRERIEAADAIRRREAQVAMPPAARLLAALDAGLPACAGTALGVDRLIMLALGLGEIDEVLAFPISRA